MRSKPLLSLRDVHYVYPGGTSAIRGISLDVVPGERVALLGENGSGKTTLARLLVGLLRPTAGSIHLDGTETTGLTTHEIAEQVGLVFQNPDHQIFLERVWDEVAFGPKNYGLAEAEIEERVGAQLRRFGLWRDRYRLPAALSGGERKSVAFASSFALRPRVLLLDEPTKGMDFGRKRRLAEVAKRLTATGRTFFFITHDVEFAFASTERAVVLRNGRVFMEGRTSDVLSRPAVADAGLQLPAIPRLLAMLRERGIPPESALYQAVQQDTGGPG
ncbi:MAG: energy-coupling factor ABC transporter ATP-binding protein [Thermoplasmata archaeon]